MLLTNGQESHVYNNSVASNFGTSVSTTNAGPAKPISEDKPTRKNKKIDTPWNIGQQNVVSALETKVFQIWNSNMPGTQLLKKKIHTNEVLFPKLMGHVKTDNNVVDDMILEGVDLESGAGRLDKPKQNFPNHDVNVLMEGTA
ncbi:hypothetical protein RYX36_013932 [Vicia faba]